MMRFLGPFLLGLALLLALPSLAASQITLSGADMPQAGDQFILSRSVNGFQIDADSTGPNSTWDFRNLSLNDQEDLNYLDGLNAPQAGNPLLLPILLSRFGRPQDVIPDTLTRLLADVSGIDIQDQFRYYDKDKSNAFRASALGFSVNQIPLAVAYDDPEEEFRFPLNFGDAYADSFKYALDIPSVPGATPDVPPIFIRGERQVEVDGWGTLRLPLGDFPVVRVSSRIPTTIDLEAIDDSTFAEPLPLEITLVNREIQWLGQGTGEPLVRLRGLEVLGAFTVWTELTFQDIDRRPVPNFSTLTPTTGCHPLKVAFQNTSKRGDDFEWQFGDGTRSTAQSPTHTYSAPGLYNVRLTAINSLGQRSLLRSDFVNVTGPVADFSFDPPTTSPGGQAVKFTNQSTGGTPPFTFQWAYGDGILSSAQSPTHIYAQPGQYSVRLVVTDANGCTDTLVKPNAVTVESPTGRGAAAAGQALRIFPQPTRGRVNVAWGQPPKGDVVASLHALTGQQVWQHPLETASREKTSLRLPEDLPAGMYRLRLRLPSGEAVNRPLMLIR